MDASENFMYGRTMDLPSFQLGKMYVFSEIVGAGVKDLALSPPLSPDDMEEIMAGASEIADEFNVHLYLDEDLLTTDLFDEKFTIGKHVLLIYKDPDVKETYLTLKAEKQKLVDAGQYQGEARKNIARGMGRLLSYQEDFIENILATGPVSFKRNDREGES